MLDVLGGGTMKKINRTPLSVEIRTAVNTLIETLLENNEKRLPSELELSKQLNVSRAALREVLTEMSNEGIIIKAHGKPTYINKEFRKMKVTLNPAIEFESAIRKLGYDSSVQVVSIKEQKASLFEMKELNLDEDETVLHINKVFFANKIPVIFCKDIFLKSMLNDYKYTNEDLIQSTFDFLYEKADLLLEHDITTISAISSNKLKEFSSFTTKNKPLLMLNSTYYTSSNAASFLTKAAFDTEYIILNTLRRQSIYK